MKRLENENKRFAERMLERSEEVEDVLAKQALRDYAINFFSPSSSSPTHNETYIDVPEILKQLRKPQKESGRYGRLVAKKYRETFKKEPKKSLKVVNGSQRECKVYTVQEVDIIKNWILEF